LKISGRVFPSIGQDSYYSYAVIFGDPTNACNAGDVVEPGKPMVKIKALIYLLLACGVGYARAPDTVTVHINAGSPNAISYPLQAEAEREIPIDSHGWSHCNARRIGSYSLVKCFHKSGATALTNCVTGYAKGRFTQHTGRLFLASSSSVQQTKVFLECSPGD
jgi:hypothetical protein